MLLGEDAPENHKLNVNSTKYSVQPSKLSTPSILTEFDIVIYALDLFHVTSKKCFSISVHRSKNHLFYY